MKKLYPTKYRILAQTFMFILVVLASSSLYMVAKPNKAYAAEALCSVTKNGDTTTESCSTILGLPNDVRAWFVAQEDRCFTYDAGATPKSNEVPCTQEPFSSLKKASVKRNKELEKQEYTQCSSGTSQTYNSVDANGNDTSGNCITFYIQKGVEFLSAGIGVIVVIMIIIGGIQYSSAGGDPQKVAAAKQRIMNALLALVAYLLLAGFLQWLIPGGWFGA